MFLHLAVEPVGQNTQKGNYDKVVGYMDALETALRALTIMNRIEYSIAMVADILVAKTTYWGLRVDVTGQNVFKIKEIYHMADTGKIKVSNSGSTTYTKPIASNRAP